MAKTISGKGELSGPWMERLRQLAEFRYQMRRFLHFSEEAAGGQGMTVQQYQLLQVIAAVPEGVVPNISYVAQRMFLRHNTAVELVARAETDGLVERTVDATDHRKATLSLTATARRGMVRLVEAHLHQLEVSGPELIRALDTLIGAAQVAVRPRSEAR